MVAAMPQEATKRAEMLATISERLMEPNGGGPCGAVLLPQISRQLAGQVIIPPSPSPMQLYHFYNTTVQNLSMASDAVLVSPAALATLPLPDLQVSFSLTSSHNEQWYLI